MHRHIHVEDDGLTMLSLEIAEGFITFWCCVIIIFLLVVSLELEPNKSTVLYSTIYMSVLSLDIV